MVMDLLTVRLWQARILPWAMTISSVWACWVLSTGPSNFQAFPSFHPISQLWDSELGWAGLFGGAAVCFAGGRLGLHRNRESLIYFLFAWFGKALQTSMWVFFALSTMWANPDTLYGGFTLITSFGFVAHLALMGKTQDAG